MREKVSKVILVIAAVGLLFYLPISAIMDLTNKKDVHSITLTSAAELFEMEHSINGLIPVGKDYYYIGMDDNGDAYVIQAGKKWLDENFNSDYASKDEAGYKMKGLAKKILDYDTQKAISDSLDEINLEGNGIMIPLTREYLLDAKYVGGAILKLVDFAVLLFAIICWFITIKKKDDCPKLIKNAATVFLVIFCLLTLKVLI